MSDTNSPLIEAPKSRGRAIAIAVVVLAVVAGLAVFAFTRGGGAGTGDDLTKVKLGTVGASDPYWKTLTEEAEKEGIDLEVIDFADYAQPNPALTEGEIDINQFQHIVYLADYNVANDQDLVPVGSTAIYPLGLYSQKVDSVDEIKDGDTVIVPDDDSNQARALAILQSSGLIKLKDGGSIFSTLKDIDQNASKVQVKAIKADLTPTSLPDVTAAIVNNDFVEKAGLKFEDAIAQDDPSDPNAVPYINVFAVRAQDKDNETYAKLIEIYQNSQKVLEGVQDVSGGTAQLLKTPATDLQASLADVEADTRARG